MAHVTSSNWCFPVETVTFLRNLKANNNREWFTEYKAAYDTSVRKPATFFCLIMEEKLHALTGHTYSSKIFRVYRDIRFSKDKTPYNAHLHISFTPKENDALGWYFGLDSTKLSLGVGTFSFSAQQLEHYRTRVAGQDGNNLAHILHEIEISHGFRLSDPELKRVPRQFDPDHAHATLLRRKGLTAWYDFDDTHAATSGDTASSCINKFTALKPVFNWLNTLQ